MLMLNGGGYFVSALAQHSIPLTMTLIREDLGGATYRRCTDIIIFQHWITMVAIVSRRPAEFAVFCSELPVC